MTRESIKKILKMLEESLEKLEPIAKMPLAEFIQSTVSQDIAKWNFYVVVQGCLDLGNQVIAVKGLESPERYEEILAVLRKNNIISENLAASLQGMGSFRNLIAHGYFKIDLEKLFGYLKKLKDVRKYLEKLEPYLID